MFRHNFNLLLQFYVTDIILIHLINIMATHKNNTEFFIMPRHNFYHIT